MCNPNSSIANRRYRAVALPPQNQATASNSPSGRLTRNLLGSILHSRVPDAVTVSHSTDFTLSAPSTLTSPRRIASVNNSSYSVPTCLPLFQHHQFNDQEARKPKKIRRRRKPQKPGKTAKQNDRHFVKHDYHDHANDKEEEAEDPVENKEGKRHRGGVAVSFPLKLHAVLDQVEIDGLAHVVSWQPHGRSFVIHKPKEFTDHIMPNYFRQTKLTSFQRQLNLYGFARITRGNDGGGYYHELFLRGKLFLCNAMLRTKVKGTKFKGASSPDEEPDFYSMPAVVVTPNSSDCDISDDGAHGGGHQYSAHPMENRLGVQHPQQEMYQPVMYRTAVVPKVEEDTTPLPYRPYESILPASPILASHRLPRNSEILDEAVDELFLNESYLGGVNDSIMDFVNVWDTAYGANADFRNDTQLGNLLDKLLED